MLGIMHPLRRGRPHELTCPLLETFDNSVELRVEYPRVRRAARSTSRLIIRGRRELTEWSFLLKTAGCSCSGGSTS